MANVKSLTSVYNQLFMFLLGENPPKPIVKNFPILWDETFRPNIPPNEGVEIGYFLSFHFLSFFLLSIGPHLTSCPENLTTSYSPVVIVRADVGGVQAYVNLTKISSGVSNRESFLP